MPNRRQAIIGTNDCIIYWRMFAALGFKELRCQKMRSLGRSFTEVVWLRDRNMSQPQSYIHEERVPIHWHNGTCRQSAVVATYSTVPSHPYQITATQLMKSKGKPIFKCVVIMWLSLYDDDKDCWLSIMSLRDVLMTTTTTTTTNCLFKIERTAMIPID